MLLFSHSFASNGAWDVHINNGWKKNQLHRGGCSSKTFKEAVRGDRGLESLRGQKDRVK